MILRRSRFVHQLPLGERRILIIHAVRQLCLPVDPEVNIILDYFAEPRRLPEDCDAIAALLPYPRDTVAQAIAGLLERQILTEKTPDEESAMTSHELASTQGRDPAEMLDRFRRELKDGSEPYWSVRANLGVTDLGAAAKR